MREKHALSGVEATLGSDLLKKIQESKILLVGAGGIGCELLKNLALSGFRHVEAIDLDTIDVSNLNRQFLFRSQHVGMPKCHVACQVALRMIPDAENATYLAHHGNVCDNAKFNVQYVSQFNLVLNALDNVTARRRVNRLCLAANVPLVEAGTTGYLGQVKVIDKASNVACYECKTQETQKVYPICTIRSTPSMPVHTIVWAKELYKLLFGPKVEESMLFEDTTGDEPSTYMADVLHFRGLLHDEDATASDKEDLYTAARNVLTKIYIDEIEKQIEMGRYTTAKTTPSPLSVEDVLNGTKSDIIPPTQRQSYKSTAIWSQVDCIAEFTSCLVHADPSVLLPAFDKDDPLAMRLVTASSNLRSYIFGIEPIQSYYSAKGIAGNIVPAIATTNAIVAGLQVLQVFHILKSQMEPDKTLADNCRYVDCLRIKMGRPGYYISSSKLDPPNPNCFVCRNATIPLSLDVNKWTLKSLLEKVIKKELGFEEPTMMLEGDIIYEEGDGADTAAYEGNLDKTLSTLPCGGIKHGTVLRVEDFSQDLEVDVCFSHQDVWEKKEDESDQDLDEKYVVGGEKPRPLATTTASVASAVSKNPESDDDEIEIVDDDPRANISKMERSIGHGKRSIETVEEPDESSGGLRKKMKHDVEGDNDRVIFIE